MHLLCGMDAVHVVECPRDALQGWATPVSTAAKVDYFAKLLQVGFGTLDFGSFVSPRHVPQMADTAAVIQALDARGAWTAETRRLVIAVNLRGAETACSFEAVDDVGFPFSLSETFSQRNAGMGRDEAWETLKRVKGACDAAGKNLVVYLSMGFGNPYGDAWSLDLLEEWAESCVRDVQPGVMSLSDTLGSATPDQLKAAVSRIRPNGWAGALGLHLHGHPLATAAKIEAALHGGCRRFDAAMGGIGGCPFAADALVGNVDTEELYRILGAMNLWNPRSIQAWEDARIAARELFN